MFLNCCNRLRQLQRDVVPWALPLAAVAYFATCSDYAARAQFLRWDIEATVVQIDKPLGILTEVRLGDPVRGTLSFHLQVAPDEGSFNSYTHPATFPVTQMIIDNPRTGDEIAFMPAKDYSAYHNVDVYSDRFIALDDVLAPAGTNATIPVTSVQFQGGGGMLPGLSLPQSLSLEDWSFALLSYVDVLGGGAIRAEIYSLTPVEVTFASADFDFDGDVDAEDLQIWARNFGTDGYPDADANFDYDADGDDFLMWQRQLNASSARPSLAPSVPESPTSLLVIVAIIICRIANLQ